MSIRDQTPISFSSAAEVDRFLAISTPPPSPLTSYSSLLPHIPSPPLPVSSLLPMSPPPLPTSPTHPLGYRAAIIRLRAKSQSTSHPLPLPPPITPLSGTPPLLPIPLPTSSPPFLLLSIDCKAGVPEVMLPPWKRLCIALGPRYEVGESSSVPTARPTGGFRADYGFVGSLDAKIRRDPEREIGYGITNIWEDPDEIAKEILATDVAELLMSSQLNLLRRDIRVHARTARLMEGEAKSSREAWVQSMDASDMTRFKVRALRTMVLAQQTEIGYLRAADRRRQTQPTEALTLLRTLQTQMAALQSPQIPARDPTHPDLPEEAGKNGTKKNHKINTSHNNHPTTSMNDEQLKRLIAQGVADVLAEREATRSGNSKDSHDSGMGGRRQAPLARECTYPDFMKCKPLYFKDTEGVVELTQWYERMETVFRISNCTMENQIKFATCTLLESALTWWNSHVRTVGHDVAYAMTWKNLKKMMTNKYCPRGEIKKLEVEMWNLKVKGTDVIGYNQRFQELALMCARMFPEESNKIERYVGGLPDIIHGSVVASKPKTMQDAIEFATELMDKKICTFAKCQSENKRKQDDNQQQQNKRQNTGKAYTARFGEKKPYRESKPLCSKCNYHHDGQCAPKCYKYNRVGHLARDYRSTANANTDNNQKGTEAGGNGNAPPKVYAVGRAGTNPDSNDVTGTFLLDNRYASILFDTGADRSFVSTAFSSQIDITPTTLDYYYDVELADERIIGLNTIIRGCTLNFLNHTFNIELQLVEIGSLDVIIGMDWLAKYQAVIVCAEKIIRLPRGNEALIIHSNGSDQGNKTHLNINSCTKTQKYMLKGCPIFFAHVTTKETEDKSKNKQLEDVPIVQNFPEAFPKYL
ncbi:putative reverse transcriptase domain-containing protein, partial [Tanacetum coccineum]